MTDNFKEGLADFEAGHYAEAEQRLVQATKQAEEDKDGATLAKSLYLLGKTYLYLEDFGKAEASLTRALAMHGKVLGTENAEIAEVIDALGTLYWNERKYSQAEPMFKRALAMRVKLFGEESVEAAESLVSLGLLSIGQNQHNEADEFLKKALVIQEDKLGDKHKDIAQTLGLIALNDSKRKPAYAEAVLRRALSIREQELSPEHPEVAMTLHQLATVCLGQEKLIEAARYYEQALEIRKNHLPENHSGIISVLNLLGYTYLRMGDHVRAYQVLHHLEELSSQSPRFTQDWCDCVVRLSHLFIANRRYEEGEDYILRTLEHFQAKQIDNDQCKLELLICLARCRLPRRKYLQALAELPQFAIISLRKALKKLASIAPISRLKNLTPAALRHGNH